MNVFNNKSKFIGILTLFTMLTTGCVGPSVNAKSPESTSQPSATRQYAQPPTLTLGPQPPPPVGPEDLKVSRISDTRPEIIRISKVQTLNQFARDLKIAGIPSTDSKVALLLQVNPGLPEVLDIGQIIALPELDWLDVKKALEENYLLNEKQALVIVLVPMPLNVLSQTINIKIETLIEANPDLNLQADIPKNTIIRVPGFP